MAEATPSGPATEALGTNPLLDSQAFLANPYPIQAMPRAANPVFRLPIPAETGNGISPLTPHADVEEVLRDFRDKLQDHAKRLYGA